MLIIGIRPLLGPACCKYEVGCTQFALMQLQNHRFIPACVLSFKRVLRCNPFMKGTL